VMALRVTLEGRRIEGVTNSGGRADIIIFSDRLYRYSIYESKRNLTFGCIIRFGIAVCHKLQHRFGIEKLVVNLLLMHGCGRSVGPLCNFDCEHKYRRQPFRLGRFLRR
jgi:hypothetical protein